MFRKRKGLVQHLNSAVHEVKLYHCAGVAEAVPSARARPVRAFKTLSGFAQHVEAGSCTGGKEALEAVVGIFETEISRATGRGVRLLRDRAA